jgi:hypothetical protein
MIGAAALTAAIAAFVSAVAPGRTLRAKSVQTVASSATAGHSTALVMPPLANPGQLGLQGPASPPQGTAPQGTAPQGTAPQGTAPQGTAPQGTQPQSSPAPVQQSAPSTVVSGGS